MRKKTENCKMTVEIIKWAQIRSVGMCFKKAY